MPEPHLVRINHDAESHAAGDDCHDDCTAEIICPGVTDACRTWWECGTCIDARRGMDDQQLEDHDELLWEAGAAHGVGALGSCSSRPGSASMT